MNVPGQANDAGRSSGSRRAMDTSFAAPHGCELRSPAAGPAISAGRSLRGVVPVIFRGAALPTVWIPPGSRSAGLRRENKARFRPSRVRPLPNMGPSRSASVSPCSLRVDWAALAEHAHAPLRANRCFREVPRSLRGRDRRSAHKRSASTTPAKRPHQRGGHGFDLLPT
jgi:hypothetical protein